MSYDVKIVKRLYESNYTSNICKMVTTAFETCKEKQFIPDYFYHWSDVVNECIHTKYLKELINELQRRPEFYKQFNPKNGWGNYEGVVNWLQNILHNWEQNDNCEVIITW